MKLLFVGDVSLGEHYFSFGHGPRSLIESGEDIFSDVKDVLKNHDLVIGNLEGEYLEDRRGQRIYYLNLDSM
jgi:hypothetical protein